MRVQVAVLISLASLCFHQFCFAQQATGALQSYVAKKDSAYSWQVENVVHSGEGTFYEVSLLSQKWQGINWTHRLIIYFPKKAKYSNTLLIVLRHLYNRAAGLAGLKYLSDSTGTASAFLYDIPNQPLFDGKEEDDLQAFTFSQYLRTGDKSWPLLFPMVKSVVRALDAIQDLSSRREKLIVSKFIVAGHSKRGHASWLSAAVDSRIKGIIPIAIDVLNAKAQMPYHLDAFGTYSTPTREATDFLLKLNDPLGESLIELIDPYAYKENLTMPKLIVCATNDEYFPTDALNLYWGGLKGNKSILYLSNAGHVRADSDPRVNPTAFAFTRAVVKDKALPQFSWEYKSVKDSIQLIISADTAAVRAVLWQASSENNDFRTSQWHAIPFKVIVKGKIKQFVLPVGKQTKSNSLIYGEVEFEQDGHKFLLSTQAFRYNGK